MENKICYLKLLFEFGQEPLWWYDSNGWVIDVGVLPEWENDKELYDLLYKLSAEYDALFLNTENKFTYIGFRNNEHKRSFCALADSFAEKVFIKNSGKYKIINDLKLDDWHSAVGVNV